MLKALLIPAMICESFNIDDVDNPAEFARIYEDETLKSNLVEGRTVGEVDGVTVDTVG